MFIMSYMCNSCDYETEDECDYEDHMNSDEHSARHMLHIIDMLEGTTIGVKYDQFETKIAQLEKEIMILKNDNAREIDITNREIKILTNHIIVKESENEILIDQLNFKKNEIYVLNNQLNTKDKKYNALIDKMNIQKREYVSLMRGFNIKDKKSVKLEDQLQTKQNEVVELTTRIKKLKEIFGQATINYEKMNDTFRNERDSLMLDNHILKNELDRIRNKN